MIPLLLALTLTSSAGDCGLVECGEDGGGVYVGLSKAETGGLANAYPPGSNAANPTSIYQYVAVIACPENSPANPRLEICGYAVNFCLDNVPGSSGPYSIIWRRTANPDGSGAGTWAEVGPTCWTDSVPAASGVPAVELTEAMIVEQFHRTDFALPQAVIQPPDGATLVNLPVYFELAWPEAGFAPSEVDTTTLVGHEVRIRPTLIGATYVTGDGSAIGPTTSLGGGYPDGDVTHTYVDTAEVSPYISVEYGGEVSVDGGDWTTIPSSAVIDGTTTPLQVLASENRLYQN